MLAEVGDAQASTMTTAAAVLSRIDTASSPLRESGASNHQEPSQAIRATAKLTVESEVMGAQQSLASSAAEDYNPADVEKRAVASRVVGSALPSKKQTQTTIAGRSLINVSEVDVTVFEDVSAPKKQKLSDQTRVQDRHWLHEVGSSKSWDGDCIVAERNHAGGGPEFVAAQREWSGGFRPDMCSMSCATSQAPSGMGNRTRGGLGATAAIDTKGVVGQMDGSRMSCCGMGCAGMGCAGMGCAGMGCAAMHDYGRKPCAGIDCGRGAALDGCGRMGCGAMGSCGGMPCGGVRCGAMDGCSGMPRGVMGGCDEMPGGARSSCGGMPYGGIPCSRMCTGRGAGGTSVSMGACSEVGYNGMGGCVGSGKMGDFGRGCHAGQSTSGARREGPWGSELAGFGRGDDEPLTREEFLRLQREAMVRRQQLSRHEEQQQQAKAA